MLVLSKTFNHVPSGVIKFAFAAAAVFVLTPTLAATRSSATDQPASLTGRWHGLVEARVGNRVHAAYTISIDLTPPGQTSFVTWSSDPKGSSYSEHIQLRRRLSQHRFDFRIVRGGSGNEFWHYTVKLRADGRLAFSGVWAEQSFLPVPRLTGLLAPG
jgi:hypothetical protein